MTSRVLTGAITPGRRPSGEGVSPGIEPDKDGPSFPRRDPDPKPRSLADRRRSESQFRMQQVAGKAFKVRQVRYWKYEQNSRRSAALDPHHNHFLLVDNAETTGWGGEHEFRKEFVKHISTKGRAGKEVPVLTICLGGGVNTFKTLVGTLERRNPLIVVKDSGGAARAVALFVEECRKKCAAAASCPQPSCRRRSAVAL